jgi:hypothetical protein
MLMSVLAGAAQVIHVPESWSALATKAKEVVNVDMDKKMLQFASSFMDKQEDAEGKQLLSKLSGIYVHSLEFKQVGAFTDADVEPIRAQLRGPEWSHIVNVNSKADKEKVDIYIKSVNNQTMGMVILAQEPMELTFVHLDGPINPDDLNKLGGNFAIPKNLPVPKNEKGAAPGSVKPAIPAAEH